MNTENTTPIDRSQNCSAAPLTVIVSGAAYTGKTIVISIIEKALRDAGFGNVTYVNPEETAEVRAEKVAGLSDKTSFPEFFQKEIIIEEDYARSTIIISAPDGMSAEDVAVHVSTLANIPVTPKPTKTLQSGILRDLPSGFTE